MEYRIQNIVFPTESMHMMCRDMFFRGEGISERKNRSLLMGCGQTCDLTTYINACSWAKWKKYTCADNLSIHISVEGDCILRYVGYGMNGTSLVRMEYESSVHNGSECDEMVFTYPDSNAVICGVEINALGICRIHKGYYTINCNETDMNPIHLCIATTTCKREKYITENIKLIKEYLFDSDDEIKDHLDVHVVDNGRTLNEEDINAKHIRLHYNKNVGGSGGFARGMIESLHGTPKATHVILMDDDVCVLPESIKRVYCLLRLIKADYREHFICGAMNCIENPNLQLEDVGSVCGDGELSPLKPVIDCNDLYSIVKNESLYFSASNLYAGWWDCCIPTSVIERVGLPLPLFVRSDDIEYSLRAQAKFITMNGIFIWHPDFMPKYSSGMEYYQKLRNLLIAKATSGILDNVDIMKYCVEQFRIRINKFEYGSAELIIRAIEDYLEGPEYLIKADGEAVFKEVMAVREKMEPLDRYPEIHIKNVYDCFEDEPRKFIDKLIYHLTGNGHRFCPEILYKKGGLPIASFSFSVQAQKITRRKRYAAINPYAQTVVIRNLDKKKYRELTDRCKKVMKLYKKMCENVRTAYQNAGPYMTSEEFWRKYLNLS